MNDRIRQRTELLVVLAMLLSLSAMGCQLFLGTETRVDGEPPTTINQQELDRAADWLIATHQNEDGGFSSFSAGAGAAPSDIGGTLDAMLALAAAGRPVDALASYLTADPAALEAYATADGGVAAKAVLSLVAAGQDPAAFGGVDLAAVLANHLQPDGNYAVAGPFQQSLAIVGAVAVGRDIQPAGPDFLVGLQADNGSWDDGFGTLDNTDATAAAVMALVAGGMAPDAAPVADAVDFLRQAQLDDGTWPYAPTLGSSTNSTALALQALKAVGVDVSADEGDWVKGGRSPMAALLALQSDSGGFQVDFGSGPMDDFSATVQAMPAISGRQLPFPGTGN